MTQPKPIGSYHGLQAKYEWFPGQRALLSRYQTLNHKMHMTHNDNNNDDNDNDKNENYNNNDNYHNNVMKRNHEKHE